MAIAAAGVAVGLIAATPTIVEAIQYCNAHYKRSRIIQALAKRLYQKFDKEYGVMVIRKDFLKPSWKRKCRIVKAETFKLRGFYGLGTIKFRAIVLNSGKIKNTGDGGYRNWCFYGGEKKGMTANF